MTLKTPAEPRHERHSSRPRQTPAWLEAEQHVRRILTDLLQDGCIVLNNVPFPYGNLDHLVIRPDGTVFLIETKSHRGVVTWNGAHVLISGRRFRSDPIQQVNRSIRWLRRIGKRIFGTNPWIVAVLAFPNAEVFVMGSVKRVNVIPANRLLDFVRSVQMKS